ncbi:MAG TPA: DUF2079 domain-containing protein, partial [Acidimicrobiales bacterium]|nr:DUF2079 domain-containing protein [Acidimicrobiales bacterium]
LAVVITELVALRWIVAVVAGPTGPTGPTARRAAPWLVLGAAVVLAVNPWAYETIAFDFHFEPFAALFCMAVGYCLWAGQIRRLRWLVPLALACHVLAGTYLVGIGLSGMLAGRRTRRPGAVIAMVGLVWFVVFSTLGASGDDGHYVGASYGYLAGPHHGRVGVFDVVAGVLRHPGAALHVAGSHWSVVVIFLVIVGMIGVVSPWGFGMALVVLGPNVLDGSGIFIRFATAFQSWPAMPFLVVGSVMMVLRLLEHGPAARRIVIVAVAVWAALLGEIAVVALPSIPRDWLSVDAAAAAVLTRVQAMVPPDAEVISTGAVIGRFAERRSIYNFETAGETFRVDRGEVVFIFTPHEVLDDALPPRAADAAVAFVSHRLGARVLGSAAGVDAFAWTPPPGTTRVRLP